MMKNKKILNFLTLISILFYAQISVTCYPLGAGYQGIRLLAADGIVPGANLNEKLGWWRCNSNYNVIYNDTFIIDVYDDEIVDVMLYIDYGYTLTIRGTGQNITFRNFTYYNHSYPCVSVGYATLILENITITHQDSSFSSYEDNHYRGCISNIGTLILNNATINVNGGIRLGGYGIPNNGGGTLILNSGSTIQGDINDDIYDSTMIGGTLILNSGSNIIGTVSSNVNIIDNR